MTWRRRGRVNGLRHVEFEDRPGPLVNFVPSTQTGVKVKCELCENTGYGPTRQDARFDDDLDKASAYAPWQLRCLMGHLQCPRCKRWLRVKLDLTARVHTRCTR